MKLHHPDAHVFIPDGVEETEAFRRITHLGIGAHQDDLEFMAFHGILACVGSRTHWFGGVTCTNGAGSARSGRYAGYNEDQMTQVRHREQNLAAMVGEYAAMVQLHHPSATVKSPSDTALTHDLREILAASLPEVVYTHNPADKHETHIGVTIAALQAMRALPPDLRPKRVIGCELWRDLDWLPDSAKVVMDVSGRDHLAAALNGIFDSQIAGGKRYDLAVLGRRAANATFFDSHAVDGASQVIFGIDLTPLIIDDNADIVRFTCELIGRFEKDVRNQLAARLGKI